MNKHTIGIFVAERGRSMPIKVSSSPKRRCFVFWLMFSFVILSNTAGIPFTGLHVGASSDPAYADVNGDGAVDILDIVTAAIAFGSDPDHPRWDSKADLNNDDAVDILDMVLILSNSKFSNSEPTSNAPAPEQEMDYALLCFYNDLSPQFLSRIVAGKIDILVPQTAHWRADNTLVYESSSGEIDSFISQVKAVNPHAKIIPCVWSQDPYSEIPDLTTPALRQKCVDEVIKFLNYKPWDGLLDDTERWEGTNEDLFDYFNVCASAVQNAGKPYYPWVHPTYIQNVNSQRHAYGAYGGHAWYENEWKTRLDYCREHANIEFLLFLMAEHYLDYPTLSQQLVWMDQKFAENGREYYSKFDVGIYRYVSMTNEDWNAWISWVNKAEGGSSG